MLFFAQEGTVKPHSLSLLLPRAWWLSPSARVHQSLSLASKDTKNFAAFECECQGAFCLCLFAVWLGSVSEHRAADD